jgi:hypothetical protein
MEQEPLTQHELEKLSHKELSSLLIEIMMYKVKIGAYLERIEKELFKHY